jgi:hypothetical protein
VLFDLTLRRGLNLGFALKTFSLSLFAGSGSLGLVLLWGTEGTTPGVLVFDGLSNKLTRHG